MPLILSVLTGRAVPLVAGIALAVLLTVIALLSWNIHSLNNRLAGANRTIGQLQGTILNVNAQVDEWKAAGDKASKAALATLQASRKASAAAEAKIAAALARPAPTDPTLACKAADDLILEVIK